jgi:RsiW-degrading membrane proteinase PrsW (M82 family)
VLGVLRWLLPATVPVALFLLLLRRVDPRRTARTRLASTFGLGAAASLFASLATEHAARLTGLDVRVGVAGQAGALIFAFFVLGPINEAAVVAATWPAFLSHQFSDAFDGLVYATAAALGFAVVQAASSLREYPTGAIWIARALLAMPADVFFAWTWGYALGRAKRAKGGLPIFPIAFCLSVTGHSLYAHFLYGRGPGAVLAVLPLLSAMGAVAWLVGRDLRPGPSTSFVPSSRMGAARPPPSMSAVRAALRRADEPVRVGWIALGSLVTLGAMITGVFAGVLAARALHVDLSTVDDREVTAAAPALMLALGLLASFPASGWLVARAASVRTLLEPALASVLALTITLITLGFAAPATVVFALAISPIAWLLSCVGAWIGRDA